MVWGPSSRLWTLDPYTLFGEDRRDRLLRLHLKSHPLMNRHGRFNSRVVGKGREGQRCRIDEWNRSPCRNQSILVNVSWLSDVFYLFSSYYILSTTVAVRATRKVTRYWWQFWNILYSAYIQLYTFWAGNNSDISSLKLCCLRHKHSRNQSLRKLAVSIHVETTGEG